MRAILTAEDAHLNPRLTRYYNPGPQRAMFEAKAREVFGSKYALGVNSGTSAHVRLRCRRRRPGHEVIVPAYTFYATAAAVVA